MQTYPMYNTIDKDEVLKKLENSLDTRDKRFMFLKICFPKLLPYINIEGSQVDTAFQIYDEFEKHGMCGSLLSCLNIHFYID